MPVRQGGLLAAAILAKLVLLTALGGDSPTCEGIDVYLGIGL
jgi:hypothetical protein